MSNVTALGLYQFTFVTLGLLSELGEVDRVFARFRHLKYKGAVSDASRRGRVEVLTVG